MNFEELDQYMHQPKPWEQWGQFFPNSSGGDQKLVVQCNELLSIHQGPSSYLRVIPHARYMETALHSHDFFEMMYVYRGSITQWVDGERILLGETEAILLSPGMNHSIESPGEADLAVSVILPKDYFSPDILQRMSRFGRILSFLSEHGTGKTPAYMLWQGKPEWQVANYANTFLCEAFDPDRYSNEALNGALQLLFTALERRSPSQPVKMSIGTDIERIMEYIRAHYATVTLGELSARFGYSENYLGRVIKSRYGMTFKNYQHQLCMEQSGFLLATTDYSVRQIAGEVGLSNITFFYKLFVHHFGVSPAEYRKRNRQNSELL